MSCGPDAHVVCAESECAAGSAGALNAADAASSFSAVPQGAGSRATWQDHTGDG